MAHINRTRTIKELSRSSFSEFIPGDVQSDSFAAFGGNPVQRMHIALNEIDRYTGTCGIVILHNDPLFEYELSRHFENSGPLQPIFPNHTSDAVYYYDPLYGLSASEVLDALVPMRDDYFNRSDVLSLRSIFSDYLTIMYTEFQKDPALFDQHPYNLDLLYDLCSMSYPELDEKVLAFLPQEAAAPLRIRLSAPGVQQRAYDAVRSFAFSLSNGLWSRRSFSQHTRLSLKQTVADRGLISIYVPNSDREILNYLCTELNSLNKSSQKYLLVTSGIFLQNCPDLHSLYIREHRTLPYCTGLLADDLSCLIAGVQNESSVLSSFFSQTQDIFVFACASSYAARPFCDAIGSYYRSVREKSTGISSRPLHLLSGRNDSISLRETRQDIINPEELVNLGSGCLIMGSSYALPYLVHRFIL